MRGVVVKHNGRLFMHSVSDLGFIREPFKIALGIYVRSVAKLAYRVKTCKTVAGVKLQRQIIGLHLI